MKGRSSAMRKDNKKPKKKEENKDVLDEIIEEINALDDNAPAEGGQPEETAGDDLEFDYGFLDKKKPEKSAKNKERSGKNEENVRRRDRIPRTAISPRVLTAKQLPHLHSRQTDRLRAEYSSMFRDLSLQVSPIPDSRIRISRAIPCETVRPCREGRRSARRSREADCRAYSF